MIEMEKELRWGKGKHFDFKHLLLIVLLLWLIQAEGLCYLCDRYQEFEVFVRLLSLLHSYPSSASSTLYLSSYHWTTGVLHITVVAPQMGNLLG